MKESLEIGVRTPLCGHTYMAFGYGRRYSLRSLPDGSFLRVEDYPGGRFICEVQTPGRHSCHVRLFAGKAVLSDYTSGTLSVFSLDEDGIPREPARVLSFGNASHIHSSWISPADGKLIVVDLGEDALYRFKDECLQEYETFHLPEGSGPRHCAFSPDGSILYVSTERSDEVFVLDYPSMTLLQKCIVNPVRPGGGSHLELSPDGRYLYVSSRLEEDGIGIFAVGPGGLLEKKGYRLTGAHPRHFSLSPDGSMIAVACRDSGAVEVYSIDPASGLPCDLLESIPMDQPVFVEWKDKI